MDVLPTAPTLANLNQRIDTLATLLKDPAAGTRLKAEIRAQSEQLAAQAKQNKPLKVVFLLLHKGQPTSIAGGNTTASALLTPPAVSTRWPSCKTTSPSPPNP